MSIKTQMTALADAIRVKSGVEGKLSLNGMTQAVNSIETGADVTLGMVNDDLNFQPVRFEGTDAVPEGDVIPVSEYCSWNNNAIILSGVPAISGTQYNNVEFDLAPYASAVNGKVKFSSSDLPVGLYLDGSVIKGSPSAYGSFASSVTVSSKGASDKVLNIQFGIEEVQIPGDSLIYYNKLESQTETDELGSELTYYGAENHSYSYDETLGRNVCKIMMGAITTAYDRFTLPSTVTLSVWAKAVNSNGSRTWILNLFQQSGPRGYTLRLDKPGVWNNSNGSPELALPAYDYDQWHHHALTFDGTTAKYYRDGVLILSGSGSSSSLTGTAAAAVIGANYSISDTSHDTEAYVSTARIYDRALNEDEIKKLASEITIAA